jgi:hypothetical protein
VTARFDRRLRVHALRVAAAVVALLAALAAAPSHAQPAAEPTLAPADWTAIRRAVTAQRDALVAGDAAAAYAFAAPGIRARHPTPASFMAMVREGYSALIDARDAALLDGAVIGGDVIQPLRLVMPDGTVLVALYTMQRQPQGDWRIAACLIAPSTLRSA